MIKIILLLALIISLNARDVTYVKICVDPDWMPIESIDKNGKHIGIIADILKLIEKQKKFKFILVPTKTWKQSISFIKQKKCDILPLASTTEDRKEWMNFTPFYIDYPEALVIRASENPKSLEEVLKFPIGLTKGYAAIDWFKNKFPDINIVEVDGADDAFAKLRRREIYSYSDTLPIVGYKLQKEGILDLKISYAFDKGVYGLNAGMAVMKGKDELYQALSLAINNLDEKQLDEILQKWVKINVEDIVDYTLIYQIFGGVLLIIGLILYWNYKLKLMVKIKTKELEKSAKELEEFANTLEDQVKKKTKEIKYLLDNARQGFLTLNKEFLINNEYSKECEVMLGKEIANKDISKILFDDTQQASKFKERLDVILNIKNKIAQLSIITLLPKEISVNGKILEAEYKVTDDILMLVFTDITEKKRLENTIKNEQFTLKMIVSIIKDNDVFFDVKDDFKYFVNNISNYIDENTTSLRNINEIYRAIHTFKGSFSQLFMNNTASHLHNVESKISDILHSDAIINNKQLLDLLQEIKFETFMNTDLENIVKILGEDFLNRNKFILVKKKVLKTIEEKFISLADKHKEYDVESILESILILSKKSLKSYLDPYARVSLQMSYNIKKPIYEFEIIGDENILLPEKFKKFMYSLIHVFRNAITHGIEDSETRINLGKNEIGTVSCSFITKNNTLEIMISDDGAGINVEKIKEQVGNKNLTDEEAYLYIFKDNFSTSDEVDELSGRGVGLSAVKFELDLLNGDIKIHSELNVGTRFVFTASV